MKSFGRNFFSELHFNPLTFDLLMVIVSGLLVAVAVVTAAVMILSRL